MQISAVPHNFRRLYSYTKRHEIKDHHKNLKQYGQKYLGLVSKWEKLKDENVSAHIIQEICGISQATYYRYKQKIKQLASGATLPSKKPKKLRTSKISEETIKQVLLVRKENPTYGKDKITVILRRDHNMNIGFSSVGKIIQKLKEQGKIIKSRSALRVRRKRKFEGHAQKWKYGMQGKNPGEMIQIDHMSVNPNQRHFKHFQAWDPTTKIMFAEVTSNATAKTAATFLKNLVENFPFPVKSIQVDGGSEFMADFEEAVRGMNIPLFVLPSKRPQWNGGVERGNRILREEFYSNPNLLADNIADMRKALKLFLLKYNGYRPHHKLKGKTPMEYTQTMMKAAS